MMLRHKWWYNYCLSTMVALAMGCLLSDATLHLIPLVGHFGVCFMLTIRVDLKVVFLFFRVIHCRHVEMSSLFRDSFTTC